jgi:3',5'-cyclic AMP phosphodiesterase CpdA
MPGLFYTPLSRREFVERSGKFLAAGAAVSLSGPREVRAADQSPRIHLALLSDTHVAADPKTEYRKFLPWENLKLALSQAIQGHPDGLILNGDAARLSGELVDYQEIKALLKPAAENFPLYIAMGNHDNRENFDKVFASDSDNAQPVKDKHVLVVERPTLRLMVLDSLLYSNKVAGLLGKAQRDWLDRYLAKADTRPTVLFVHHTLGEEDGELLDAEALFRIVRPYRKVKAIFYGHSHQYSYAQDHGIHLVNLPAVGYNFADKEPVGWVDAQFSGAGVDLTLHAFGGNRQKDTQTTSLSWRG